MGTPWQAVLAAVLACSSWAEQSLLTSSSAAAANTDHGWSVLWVICMGRERLAVRLSSLDSSEACSSFVSSRVVDLVHGICRVACRLEFKNDNRDQKMQR